MKRIHVLLAVLVLSAGALGYSSGPRFLDLWTDQTAAGAKTWTRQQAITDASQDVATVGADGTITTTPFTWDNLAFWINCPPSWNGGLITLDPVGAGTNYTQACAAGGSNAVTTTDWAAGTAVDITVVGGGSASIVAGLGHGKAANLAIDTNVLTVNGLTNRVGVNTTNPTVALDVTGAINASGALTLGTVLAQAEGGTGAGALTCAAGEALTSNGTIYSCASAGAPTDAAYLTNGAVAGLSAEVDVSSGLTFWTTTTPVIQSNNAADVTLAFSNPGAGVMNTTLDGAATFTGTVTPNGNLDLAGASSTILNSGANNGGSVPFTDALRSLVTAGPMLFESSTTATGGADVAYRFTPASTFTTAADTLALFENSAGADALLLTVGGAGQFAGTVSVASNLYMSTADIYTPGTLAGVNLRIYTAANASNEVALGLGTSAVLTGAGAADLTSTPLVGMGSDMGNTRVISWAFTAGGALTVTPLTLPNQTAASGLDPVDSLWTGQTGGASTYATGVVTGGPGAGTTFTAGPGGACSGAATTNNAGAGGSYLFNTGAGGNSTNATTNNGGNSGSFTVNLGAVGTGSTANGTSGTFAIQAATTEVASIMSTGQIKSDATAVGAFSAVTNVSAPVVEDTTIGAFTPSVSGLRSARVTCTVLAAGTCAACADAVQVSLEGTTCNLGAICTSAAGTTATCDAAVVMAAGTTYDFQITSAGTTCSADPQLMCNIELALVVSP